MSLSILEMSIYAASSTVGSLPGTSSRSSRPSRSSSSSAPGTGLAPSSLAHMSYSSDHGCNKGVSRGLSEELLLQPMNARVSISLLHPQMTIHMGISASIPGSN